MTHINHYDRQRQYASANCLKVLARDGETIAIEIYKGAIVGIVMNLIALIGRNAASEFLQKTVGDVRPPWTKPTLLINNTDVA